MTLMKISVVFKTAHISKYLSLSSSRFLCALTHLTSLSSRLVWSVVKGSVLLTVSVWRKENQTSCLKQPLWSAMELQWWSWPLMSTDRFGVSFYLCAVFQYKWGVKSQIKVYIRVYTAVGTAAPGEYTCTDTEILACVRLSRRQILTVKWRSALEPISSLPKSDLDPTTSFLIRISSPLAQALRSTVNMPSTLSKLPNSSR